MKISTTRNMKNRHEQIKNKEKKLNKKHNQ